MNQLDIGRCGRVLTVFAAVLAAAILVAACGGSKATHTRKAADANSTIKFARCMRANGVPSFPDSGGAYQQNSNGQDVSIDGVSVSSPAFFAAMTKCQKRYYKSSGAPPSAAEQAKATQAELKQARCMRAHGIKAFPDSGTFNTSGALNPQAPAFKAAAKKCGIVFDTGGYVQ